MAKIPKVLHEHINTAFPATPHLWCPTMSTNLKDGSKVTVVLPESAAAGGRDPAEGRPSARFYGVASLHKKCFGVLIQIERAQDLDGAARARD